MKCRHLLAGVCLSVLLTAAAELCTAAADGAPAELESTASSQSQEQADAPLLTPLGIFTTTGYCPCESCSGRWGRLTSTGALACAEHTAAVDPQVIPYGSRLMINGTIYTAEDCGGGVNGNHIDIFYSTHEECRVHGTQTAEVYLVQQAAAQDAAPSPLS